MSRQHSHLTLHVFHSSACSFNASFITESSLQITKDLQTSISTMLFSRDESKERSVNPTFRINDRLDRRARSSYMYFDEATYASSRESVGEEVFYVTADYLHRYRNPKQWRGILHRGIIFALIGKSPSYPPTRADRSCVRIGHEIVTPGGFLLSTIYIRRIALSRPAGHGTFPA